MLSRIQRALPSLVAVLLIGLQPACADDSESGLPPVSVDARSDIAWQDVGVFPISDLARTATVTVNVPPAQRFVALRVIPLHDGVGPKLSTVCYQLDRVVTGSASWVDDSRKKRDWGPACRHCSQRVASNNAAGSFVFPNDGRPLGDPGQVRLRVVLRDCATGVAADKTLNPDLPARVRVELATADLPAPGAEARLRFRLALYDGTALPDGEPTARLKTVFGGVRDHFAAVGIDAQLEVAVSMPVRKQPAGFGRGQSAALDAMYTGALAAWDERLTEPASRFVPVLVTRCLVREKPGTKGAEEPWAGVSTRIPGGLAPPGLADTVVIADPGCGSTVARKNAELAVLIAHETGHFLGLFHSDTAWADHRRAGSGDDLMHSNAAGLDLDKLVFTKAQAAVMKAHPTVFYDPL